MKFKKWIVENKYGISQMKIWSKETPIENEENPATCHIDKETSIIEFIVPTIKNFIKDIGKIIYMASQMYILSVAFYGFACLKIPNTDLKQNVTGIIPIIIFAMVMIELFFLIKNHFTQTRNIREILSILTLLIVDIFYRTILKNRVMSLELLTEVFIMMFWIGIICFAGLFIFDVVHMILSYKKGKAIIISEEKRINYRFVK